MKIFVNTPREDWICDALAKEFKQNNPDICDDYLPFCSHIWVMASWCFKQQPLLNHLSRSHKKVLTTHHHFAPEKFNKQAKIEFDYLDEMTTAYHVPNFRTRDFIQKFTKKQIHVIPYWANQNIWKVLSDTKDQLRDKHQVPRDAHVVFSAQRDTEGNDNVSPKLEKGPDLFCDAVIKLRDTTHPNVHVVLAGWRRQYVMNRLKQSGVPFSYFELPKQNIVNELYNLADLYIVSSRHEGGPQALIECGLTNLPVVSTPVGIAEEVLIPESINADVTLAKPSVPDIGRLMLPHGFKPYIDLLKSL